MKQWRLVAMMSMMVVSCAAPQALEVRSTHLRNLETPSMQDEPMVRAEQENLLHGAIGLREQEQRLGHYYVVRWNDASQGEPVKVLFEFQQGSTGSQIHRQEASFDASETSGKAEFVVNGDSYLKGGRVLAWQCRLFRGDREIARRRSYLWE
ncbi:hypothetical protein HNR46_000258 [Haloferula luteola]|uniref:Lipoprotein n=1 Tax=Haloferula luteola TaxID=595692 RepID=A0A840UV18_9BACT|nr:hypothetical protein [Haloferula luteola]MBB5350037.1 hypothetical protein [Haloferula luteola]